MLRRAFVLLLATVTLAGCGGGYNGGSGGYQPPTALGSPGLLPGSYGPQSTRGVARVAILLPLTGPRADIGAAMLRAAQLALPEGQGPALDVRDTAGTPEGAAEAARTAIAAGAGLILGPLTSTETAAVAPIARDAGVAVLAFTNDPAQAQPGVWTLGITPGQQVRRLVAAAKAQDRTQIAALLPNSDLGRAMGDALNQATVSAGLTPPEIRTYSPGMGSINGAVRDLSGYASRRGPIDAQIKAARLKGTPEGRHEAQELAKSSIPGTAFNALLMGDTGDSLAEIASLLPYYDVNVGAVQIMGPAQWALAGSGSGHFSGAWYAAPDPAARATLEEQYTTKYGSPPPAFADLAYDAAAIARVLAGGGQFSVAALSQPAGFTGVDGWLALLPDGEVRRGLAVFKIDRGGPTMVEPAPTSLSGTGT